MTFIVLTDGECTGLEPPSNPLDAKVQVKRATIYTSRLEQALRYRWSGSMAQKVVTWAIVLFVVFYIATEPSGAAGFVHQAFKGLHDAAKLHGSIRELALGGGGMYRWPGEGGGVVGWWWGPRKHHLGSPAAPVRVHPGPACRSRRQGGWCRLSLGASLVAVGCRPSPLRVLAAGPGGQGMTA